MVKKPLPAFALLAAALLPEEGIKLSLIFKSLY